jgi:hypothetical protein
MTPEMANFSGFVHAASILTLLDQWRANGGYRAGNLVRWRASMGRQRQFVACGCSRSAAIVFRSAVATRERPLSRGSDFSTLSANDRLLSAPVARPEKCS